MFTVTSDSVASVSPTLVATGDPAGTYQWSVTFFAGGQSEIGRASCRERAQISVVAVSLKKKYWTTSAPYKPIINLTGSGVNSVTRINWSCTKAKGGICSAVAPGV